MTITFEGRSFPLHPTNSGRVGIDNLRQITLFAGSIWRKISRQMEDGKISVFEAATSVFALAEGLQFLPKADQIRAEIMDLSEAEAAQLLSEIGREFGFDPAKAREVLQKIVVPSVEIATLSAGVLSEARVLFKR